MTPVGKLHVKLLLKQLHYFTFMQNSKVGAENDLLRDINTKSRFSFRAIFVYVFFLLLFCFGLIYVFFCLFAFRFSLYCKEEEKRPNTS